jgi:hypothetical protein
MWLSPAGVEHAVLDTQRDESRDGQVSAVQGKDGSNVFWLLHPVTPGFAV